MKKIYKNLNKTAFWVCLLLSIALIVGGFFCPPMAEISGSVLSAVGELFGFATLGTVIDAISKGSEIRLRKGDAELSVNNSDENIDN